ALDAARRPSPPRPQRGPRRRPRPSPPPVPRPTPVTPRLGVFNRRPPTWFCGAKTKNPSSVVACALDPGVDATAAARPELRSRLPFTAVHHTVHRPQHLHGSSPSTLDTCVPATKDQAHDHTTRLTIHSSQPGVSTARSSKEGLL